MRRITAPSLDRRCQKCGGDIPSTRRADASYCSNQCRDAAEKARYCARHPDYVKKQRRLVTEIRHLKEHGHTRFIDDPSLNPKDRYRVARSLGYRSMLEYNVAKQLTELGVPFQYEAVKIRFVRPIDFNDLPEEE